MKVNLYNFNNTIYDGICSFDFYLFCLKKKPLILRFMPVFLLYYVLFKLNLTSQEKMQEKFYLFVRDFKSIDNEVKAFWIENEYKIKDYYLKQKHCQDIIISTSPHFLLKPICKKLKVKDLIASNIDKKTGKLISQNRYNQEKYSNLKIEETYSNNPSDILMPELTQKNHLLKTPRLSFEQFLSTLKKILYTSFIFSLPFMTLLLCGDYELKYIKITIVMSFVSGIIIKKYILKKISWYNANNFNLVKCLLISLYSVKLLLNFDGAGFIYIGNLLNRLLGINFSITNIKILIGFLAVPSFTIIVYYLLSIIVPFVKKETYELSSLEKRFLILTTCLGFISTAVIYNQTSAFYFPVTNGMYIPFDVIYTSDSGILYKKNAFLNVGMSENDLRQPLFGLFAMPFSLLANIISEFTFFVPNSYPVIFNTIQIMLLQISLIMLCKMLGLKDTNKKELLFLFCSSFSTILFSFLTEQYVIAFFYLILTLYISNKQYLETNYLYIGAVGTLLISGIIFPTISKFASLKKWCQNILKCFIAFFILTIITGQVIQIFTLNERIEFLTKFTGEKIDFIDRLKQFLYFVSSTIIAPKSHVLKGDIPRYLLAKVESFSAVGIIIIILSLISLIVNRKDKMVQISFAWSIFSFFILCVIGWGTQENGLILYTLYFAWSYIILIYMLLKKLFRNDKFRSLIIICICIFILYFNLSELLNIIKFGVTYYKPF